MAATVMQKRATRASLTALGVASNIVPGQVYLLTDEGRLAVGLTPTAFQTFAKESEASGAPWVVKSANYTASNGDRILADTLGGPWTLTLPVGGAMVEVLDHVGGWSIHNLTVATTAGEVLRGAPGGLICDQTASLQFQGLGNGVWLVKKIGLAAGRPPDPSSPPVISGQASVGQTLTVSDGVWGNSPTTFTRQWFSDGVAIAGANGQTYVVSSFDIGKYISVKVTASNGDGAVISESDVTLPVSKSYSDFEAHIESIAVNGPISWTGQINISGSPPYDRKYFTTASEFSGPLYGSPSGSRVATSSGGFNSVARIVQHSLPNGDVSGATSGQKIYFEIERVVGSNPALVSKSINGFTSTAVGENAAGSGFVRRIIWWSAGRAWWRDPYLETAPSPYYW